LGSLFSGLVGFAVLRSMEVPFFISMIVSIVIGFAGKKLYLYLSGE